MRMVFNIAKAELRTLFYSPVAWFLAIAFLVQCGLIYTTQIAGMAKMQEFSLQYVQGFKDFSPWPLTTLIFLGPESIYTVALQNLYLFIPLLTMGLISREVTNGSIRLLYSSPVKLRKVVLGKYLAIVAYSVVLLCIAGIFLLTAAFNIRDVDYGMLLSALLGFFLLTCAYAAIGVFMSSLTNYQIVSALGSFLIIFALSRIGYLWQKIDFVRDLTYFLFLEGRTTRMLKGLIATRDVVYFLVVIGMFLGFTLIRLRAGREVKPWYVKLGRTVAVVAVCLTTGYICSLPRFTFYWDTTARDQNTIHERTQQIIREMDDAPLEVTLYTNLLGGEVDYGLPSGRNQYIDEMWEKYLRFKHNIKFNYVYYYYYDRQMDGGEKETIFAGKDNQVMAREIAKGKKLNIKDFMPPEAIEKIADLHPEGDRLLMQVKYKDRTEWLRTYQTSMPYPDGAFQVWPSEQNVAATLKRLLDPGSIPKVLYTTGNLERSIYKGGDREFWVGTIMKSKGDALINLGFDIDTINLDQQSVPDSITALVVADPKTALSENAQNRIREFIAKGGNMMFMGEPGKQDILNPVLGSLGVALMEGSLVQPTYDEVPNRIMADYTITSAEMSEENLMLKQRRDLADKFPHDTMRLLMPGVTAIAFADSNGFVKKPLLLTNASNSWLKKGPLVTDSAAVMYNQQEGDIKGSFAAGMQLTRQINNKQQRIAVLGDADFISKKRVLTGESLHRTIYHWLDDGGYPVYVPLADPKDTLYKISYKAAKVQYLIYVWILPALIMISAIILLVRRKRK